MGVRHSMSECVTLGEFPTFSGSTSFHKNSFLLPVDSSSFALPLTVLFLLETMF